MAVDGGGRRKRPRKGVVEVPGGRANPEEGSGEQGRQQGSGTLGAVGGAMRALWPRPEHAPRVLGRMPMASTVPQTS